MCRLHLQVVWLFVYAVRVVCPCSTTDDTCEYWLEVKFHLTMMNESIAVFPANGKLFRYDVKDVSTAQPINASHVITADGWERPRLVIAVNNSMPGPPIEVYEGQTVIVHVRNTLSSETVTIHWHGIHQQDTPWMDGVAFITQCPILPGVSFTYTFKAYPKGTHWYHSHVGSQMSMGLLGAFIVRERTAPVDTEFIMMLQDWNHDWDGDMIHLKMLYGNYENRTKAKPSGSLEGALFSMFPFHSGLINGRGRFYDSEGIHNEAPLTVYTVQPSRTYRFRVIGAGSLYPFRVSVDQHPMRLLASDGYPMRPELADSFIINPGERYDFEITTNQTTQNYWIIAETLEVNVTSHMAEAILRYEGAPDSEPTTQRKSCTRDDRCRVVNCPFSFYPENAFTDCKHLGELRAEEGKSNNVGASKDKPEAIEEIFLNFVFPGTIWTPAAVNGRSFKAPTVSALTQAQELNTYCDPNECGEEKVCRCTYSIDLEHNKVYQLVFLNMGVGKGWAHPVHLHGHLFYVLKMGYPEYNETTGRILGDNLDLDCHGNPNRSLSFCNSPSWKNSSWGGNNIPDLELELPLQKDTIIVPTGGYVVVRLRADNPGLWFIHCHIELHSSDGMALMFNESFSRQLPPPGDFPRCGDFTGATEKQDNEVALHHDDPYTKILFWAIVGCLIAIIVICIIIIFYLVYRCRSYRKATSENCQDGHVNSAFGIQDSKN